MLIEGLGQAALDGFVALLIWPTPAYALFGVLIGMVFGIIPGLSGLTGMALLFPVAFILPPTSALAFLIGMYAATTQTDTIPAVLFGIPGTAAAQATVVDGYPLAQQGQAGRALGAAFVASIVGVLVSVGIFSALLPFMSILIRQFGSPEFFMVGIFSITLVGVLSNNQLRRGLIVGLFGLLLSTVGMGEVGSVPRFVFNTMYLWEGLPLVPVVLGLFAVPEMLKLVESQQSIAKGSVGRIGGTMQGIKDVYQNLWLTVRCSIIGAGVGIIPGLGGSVVDWIGYGYAVQSTKGENRFGKGDIRGIIAPESAAGAQKPGALLPTVIFGLPGNASMAILLGVMMILGLRPGGEMLTTNLSLLYLILWMMVLANILAALICFGLSRYLAMITFLPSTILISFMLPLMMLGAVSNTGAIGDILVFMGFGLFGFWMDRQEWPRIPMILGLILGPIIEPYFFLSMKRYGIAFLTRPIVLVLVVLTISVVVGVAIRNQKVRRQEAGASPGHVA